MDFMDLVKFIVPREEREKREHFKKYTASSPNIHFVAIITIGKQAFRGSVPTGRDVFSEGRFTVNAAATAEICKFNSFSDQ